ncbi:3'-5' exonuclease [Sphingomonas sp. NFR15]|uniref:3'-5' exonuclease n=1 Tax=Sphingomonas sp. NFR15 TaxID=1566282 RepID=UPI000884F0B9|nr:3'-5' exonuclease [Sphingomonas sp. NFR15]SDA15143.1 DNA polymerase-3 subunit epsilon [Sphingomonas sp. NFR15]
MILGYDTETTGLPRWKEPSDHPQQPHLVQLAMILFDMEGREVTRWANLVKPGYGAVMEPEAFEAHGITLERARDEGVEPRQAFAAFQDMLLSAKLMVGHNESFDRRMMRIHAARHLGFKWEPPIPNFCTLYRTKYIMRLPATPKMIAAGVPGPKSPNLGECVKHFLGEEMVNAHDALADIEYTMRVFWHLVQKLNVPMFKAPSKAKGFFETVTV